MWLLFVLIGIVVQATQITAVEDASKDSKKDCDLNELCSRVRRLERKLETKYEELEKLVKGVKSNCVTNIRLTDPQEVLVWRGPGFQDTNGWVITGATNWNSDDLLDRVKRRRLEKEVNGGWSTIA